MVGLSEDDEILIPEKPSELIVSRIEERRFMRKVYRMQCSDSRLDWLDSLQPSEVIDLVMRKGKIDLGDTGRLVKCPCRDNPAACFVVDDPREGVDGVFCCGVAVEQKKRRSLSSGLKKKTVFDTFELWSRSCSYWPGYLASHRGGFQELLHFVLSRCSDVTVTDEATKFSDFS